jgi:hypothetical protein
MLGAIMSAVRGQNLPALDQQPLAECWLKPDIARISKNFLTGANHD